MANWNKLLIQIMKGSSDGNISFTKLCQLLQRLGFNERVRGSHHIFTKAGVKDILNLQPKGSKAKIYQVKQVRKIILKYKLGNENGQI